MTQLAQTLSSPVLVALDTVEIEAAKALAEALASVVGGLKLGKEFFTAHGPAGVQQVAATGMPVFLDLKFHDIPNTVAGALRASLPLEPLMVNVHASGGKAMLEAAVRAVDEAEAKGFRRPMLLAVTVLTSLEAADLAQVGQKGTPSEQVQRLACLAQDCGLDGVVCSAHEINSLRQACGPDFQLVVPGIRPTGSEQNDQKRIMTPTEAMAAGANWLVIGRPITKAANPRAAAQQIADELALRQA